MTVYDKQPVRVAFRKEGEQVNAYMAEIGTMDGAILLSSLHVVFAQNPTTYKRWKDFVLEVFKDVVTATTGATKVKIIEKREVK